MNANPKILLQLHLLLTESLFTEWMTTSSYSAPFSANTNSISHSFCKLPLLHSIHFCTIFFLCLRVYFLLLLKPSKASACFPYFIPLAPCCLSHASTTATVPTTYFFLFLVFIFYTFSLLQGHLAT